MHSTYQSPPNWPPPPAGWVPPQGWAPDPSWPQPPNNWQFWVPGSTTSSTRKKRQLWLKVGLPLAVTVVGLLIVAGTISLFAGVATSVKPAERATNSYLQALKDHRYDAAFAMRCSADLGGHDTFVQHWNNQSSIGHGIAAFKILALNVQNFNGRSSAQAQLEVRYADGYMENQQLPLTKTGSTWKPCP